MKVTTFAILILALLSLSACAPKMQVYPVESQYCNPPGVGKVYYCDNSYTKFEYDNLGGGITWMKGDQEIRCPVVGPDSMSAECKALMDSPPNCTLAVTCPENGRPNGAQLANPASVNCVNRGGQLEIRDTTQGQVGYCLINGSECEEWALFRGEGCVPPVENGTVATTDPAGFVACPQPRPTPPVACTMEYNPVCGVKDNGIRCVRAPCPSTDNVTYGNACSACADPLVYGYVPGACGNSTK